MFEIKKISAVFFMMTGKTLSLLMVAAIFAAPACSQRDEYRISCSPLWVLSDYIMPLKSLICLLNTEKRLIAGFISLDCGDTESYIDDAGIQWMPDDAYINSGQKMNLTDNILAGKQSRQMNTLRRFPERRKSCYQLTPVEIGTKYLLRGTFVYGNYDNLNLPPQFDLLLDADIWDGLSFRDSSTYVVQKEIVFMAKFDPTHVCLARINDSYGLPIISSLELRPLNHSMYWPVNQDYSLLRLENSNFGAQVLDSDIR